MFLSDLSGTPQPSEIFGTKIEHKTLLVIKAEGK